MATVPGPGPDRPLPRPGAPDERPIPGEDERIASPPEREEQPSWEPEPYDPEREYAEPSVPAGVP